MRLKKTNRLQKKTCGGAEYVAETINCHGYGETKEKALKNLILILEQHSDKYCQMQVIVLTD